MVYPGLEPDENGLVGVGGRLTPELVVEMYARGVFPWTGEHPIPWFSPDPRLILEPGGFKLRRSLRKRIRNTPRLEVRFDSRFREVMLACASTPREGEDGTWITDNMVACYCTLHDLGIGHSVEVYIDGELVGGLYGLSLGLAFFGESMFHRRTDMSKVALWALCSALEERGFHFVDCQQETRHLESLGAHAIPRHIYLRRLDAALAHPVRQHSWSEWAPRIALADAASSLA